MGALLRDPGHAPAPVFLLQHLAHCAWTSFDLLAKQIPLCPYDKVLQKVVSIASLQISKHVYKEAGE